MNQNTFTVTSELLGSDQANFIISPLPRGYGQSIGNALRRTLLTSIGGLAGTYIKINDEVHPFSTIKGVKETVLEIILNCKKLNFEGTGEGPFKINLKKTGKTGQSLLVTGNDFSGSVKVVNGDVEIAELTDSTASLEIEITVEHGFGYSSRQEKENIGYGLIALDSIFSPVVRVSYDVQDERVGRSNNYDRLLVSVTTDGSISPLDAYNSAVTSLMSIVTDMNLSKDAPKIVASDEAPKLKKKVKSDKVLETIIDELDLPTRVINALLREGIETVGDLINKGREDLVNMKGVGRKSVDLIDKELGKLGLGL